MQCAAVLFQKEDVWLLSMDHEEGLPYVGTLTREYCRDMKGEDYGPIILSHGELPNLILDHEHDKIQDPMFTIFMEDEERDVPVKIRNAHCPAKVAEGNPCLEYIKHIVLPWFGCFQVPSEEENSGGTSRTFRKMEELIADYESGVLHPTKVKLALTKALNNIMETVRGHFADSSEARDLKLCRCTTFINDHYMHNVVVFKEHVSFNYAFN
ncbi:tyrosine--tRNA ligase 1, cytoplasmic-like [Aegilops tauschii subsp. strangulata]|uniref:tyrosine--tRNA ligase n=1 Tax=Aegilops tauschii TaxID=37682 RepID=M8BXI6_AEGTA|nr:tyrosine--tRNA ligase 2, cytoplasmic-like [Aegilops tauschii subsp. strangulata]